MDSVASLFESVLDARTVPLNLPPRRVTPMMAQQVVPWTPARLAMAFGAWVMEETPFPAPARTDA